MRSFTLFICLFILSACYGDDVYYGLRIAPKSIDLISGENATIYAKTNRNSNHLINWFTSDPLVVSVDNVGNVSSYDCGQAFVSANIKDEQEVCVITVKERSFFWLHGQSKAYSDMTWVEDYLVGFGSSDDNNAIAGYIDINGFENGVDSEPTSFFRLYHLWGHCNTVDYNNASDCLIMGNGSSDYNLPGKIIIIPNFKSLILSGEKPAVPLSLEDVHALVIDCKEYKWGSKFNVVWGQSYENEDDVAYIISAKMHGLSFINGGDMEVIRKIGLCKGNKMGEYGTYTENQSIYNGTFNLNETYRQETDGYNNCNQGSCYFNNELMVAVGHDGLWYWRMTLRDGNIYKKTYKSSQFTRDTIDGNASGVAVKDGYLFIGCANMGIMAIRL